MLVYLVVEFKAPEHRQPHVVVADLQDWFLDVYFTYLTLDAAIFNCNKVDIVVDLQVYNKQCLVDGSTVLLYDIVHRLVGSFPQSFLHVLLKKRKRLWQDV